MILIVVVVLAVVVGGYALLKKDDSKDNNNNSSSSSSSSSSNSNESSTDASESAVITYSESGFSPSKVTVKSGSTITVKNDTSEEIGFKSNPHPVHTDNTELNLEDLEAGESRSFTVSKVGTWGFHNHYDPSKGGTIVVEE